MQCSKCGNPNPPGARVCGKCYAALPRLKRVGALTRALRSAVEVPVGEILCVVLLLALLALVPKLRPAASDLRSLLLHFGLLGTVALGALFPFLKGHYDLSCGPVAGLAACVAVIASNAGALEAAVAGVMVGAVAGAINGVIAGCTTIPSLLLTVAVGAVGTHLTLYLSSTRELVVTDPLFESLGSASFHGLPPPLLLLVAAMLGAHLLLRRETFLPVGSAGHPREAAARGDAEYVLAAFVASGVLAGVAGVFIAAAQMPVAAPAGQATWLLAPIAGLLLGGASSAAGRGSMRVAVTGAGCLALANWFLGQLRVPLGGPAFEAAIIVAGLLWERWRMASWYHLYQLRRGDTLALPEELRLPAVLPIVSRVGRPILVLIGLSMCISAYAYIGYYAARHVPTGTVVVGSTEGVVEAYRAATARWDQCVPGAVLGPGDAVRTGFGSQAVIRFSDGSYTRLYANTSLYIQELEEGALGRKTRLYMDAGRLWASVRKLLGTEARFEVDSPLLTVAVRGTIFLMIVERDQSSVEVAEGSVEVVRKYWERDAQTGATVVREQRHILQMGEWIGRVPALDAELPQELPQDKLRALREATEKLSAELRRVLLNPSFWHGLAGIIIGVTVTLLILSYVIPPAPPLTPLDVAKRAEELEAQRGRKPKDASSAAGLAQLYLNMGQLEQARAELEFIVRTDPNSEYGQWAQRMLVRLEGRRTPPPTE